MCILLCVIGIHKLIELILVDAGRFDSPKKKRSDWVVPHQTVEQAGDLGLTPDQFALNSWKCPLPFLNVEQCIFDRDLLELQYLLPQLNLAQQSLAKHPPPLGIVVLVLAGVVVPVVVLTGRHSRVRRETVPPYV